MPRLELREAIREALDGGLARDERVVFFGQREERWIWGCQDESCW
jgi:hypothetical protein